MKKLAVCFLCGVSLVLRAERCVESFNDGWEFSRDQKSWRAVDVPHDWGVESKFDPKRGDRTTGRLPWSGVGYYRRRIVLPSKPNMRRVFFEFDGIMCDGTVFVNGHSCGHQAYGYLGVTADATPYLCAGTNTVLVRADTTKLKSRWYPGAGLYRRVRKIETDDIYLDPRDLAVTTPEVTADRAVVCVEGAVTSRRLKDADVCVEVEVRAPDGTAVAKAETRVSVARCGKVRFTKMRCEVDHPQLWKMEDNTKLYTTVVRLRGVASDEISLRTGFRAFRFDAEKGFFLNGERVQLKGVCLHSDLGILGMAFNKSAMRRQLRIMKDMGVNALRTSHNPPAPEVLDLCDEMGLFVWDECFDKWNGTCGRTDEPMEEFVEARLREFVRRDRNHPCVFVWSIGNEIVSDGPETPGAKKWKSPHLDGTTPERCARFRETVRAEDATRPVGLACCVPGSVPNGDYDVLDVTGWNYGERYMLMRKRCPDKPILYTESASAFSEYGYYAPQLPKSKTDYAVKDLAVDSYDRNSAGWSDIPDREFERMERDRFVAGEFVWTGIDYLGEPVPYWEDGARSAYFGICDLLVFPKDRTYLYRAYWNKSAFTLHIVPDHWTFPERTGRKMPVYVYTSADEAELFVNGVSQGRRRKDPSATMEKGYYGGVPRYRLIWDEVVYQPGEVKCVAYGKDGKALGEETLRTAEAPDRVVLTPESATLPADPEEFVFVKVTLADAKGTPVPRDHRRISFAVEGPAKIVSVGNSDPRGTDSFKDTSSHPLRYGRAGLVLCRTGPGRVTLKAASDGLKTAVFDFPDNATAKAP